MMKGKRIAFVAEGVAELEEYEVLPPGRGQALIETECTLISPGTERDCLLDLTAQKGFPKYLGYSAVGRIRETGGEAGEFKPGDRVAVYHSIHASHQCKSVGELVKIEDAALPSEEAVFCVIAAMGVQGVQRVRPELGESMVVMGLGLLGLFALQGARLSGSYPLIALDFNPERRQLALKLGADAVFAPDDPALESVVMELTGGRGADSVIEVSGAPEAVVQAFHLTARFGRIALVGCSRTPTREVDFYHDVHRPGITVIGAHNMARPEYDSRPGCRTMRDDMKMLLRYFAAGRMVVRPMLTAMVAPEQAKEVYARIAGGDPELLGTVFRWNNFPAS